jgi:hypothetical protein
MTVSTGRTGQIPRVLSCPSGAGRRTNGTSVRSVRFVRSSSLMQRSADHQIDQQECRDCAGNCDAE